jgi:hypothetical protein
MAAGCQQLIARWLQMDCQLQEVLMFLYCDGASDLPGTLHAVAVLARAY